MTNYERLTENIGKEHKPFIVYDIETTGTMNGNDNRITQIALASYGWNAKEKRYELQDNLFMLAKVDGEVLDKIAENELPIQKNARRRLFENYLYKEKVDIRNCEKRLETLQRKGTAEDAVLQEYKRVEGELERRKTWYEIDANAVDLLVKGKCEDMSDLVLERSNKIVTELFPKFDDEIEAMKQEKKLAEVLLEQGTSLEELKRGVGLTSAELQTGISNFLDKYAGKDTVFINNGTVFAKHYLEKQGLVIAPAGAEQIDLTQAQRSVHGGGSTWTTDIYKFAENYKQETGKEIKTFDAYTKALCFGEMVMSMTGNTLVNTSREYIENRVREEAMSKDKDYVLSLARASSLSWVPASKDTFYMAGYHFDSLEYVDFGTDRRYVDIDKMFEMNDNFEVTLEGEKTPIKTWEELEAKIKALNADISQELLDRIHEKFEEVQKQAEEKKTISMPVATIPDGQSMFEKNFSDLTSLFEGVPKTDMSKKQEDLEKRMEQAVKPYIDNYDAMWRETDTRLQRLFNEAEESGADVSKFTEVRHALTMDYMSQNMSVWKDYMYEADFAEKFIESYERAVKALTGVAQKGIAVYKEIIEEQREKLNTGYENLKDIEEREM